LNLLLRQLLLTHFITGTAMHISTTQIRFGVQNPVSILQHVLMLVRQQSMPAKSTPKVAPDIRNTDKGKNSVINSLLCFSNAAADPPSRMTPQVVLLPSIYIKSLSMFPLPASWNEFPGTPMEAPPDRSMMRAA
jgi:hypothetical protein